MSAWSAAQVRLIASHLVGWKDGYLQQPKMERGPGNLFRPWDKPRWVGAEEHSGIRDDDYVLGFEVEDRPYCVPLYIIDYYHVINGDAGGVPLYFSG